MSAAFYTIDHNILITRLSYWFDIHGSASSSLTFHLTPFVLNVITTSLPFILPLVVFPNALFSALYSSSCTLLLSVLLCLLFPLTTTFTQTVRSSSSLSTHSTLTQAFLSFKKLFNRTTNLLTLNSCKTQFLLIGLKNQLAKIHNLTVFITVYLKLAPLKLRPYGAIQICLLLLLLLLLLLFRAAFFRDTIEFAHLSRFVRSCCKMFT